MKTIEKRILVLHGPNLNMLGKREPEVYGALTLEQLNAELAAQAAKLGVAVECRQTNHEGVLVDMIQAADGAYDCIIINPAAFTHYSYGLADAAHMVIDEGLPLMEVHISNPSARDEFRKRSVISPVATGTITGMGFYGYKLAIEAVAHLLEER